LLKVENASTRGGGSKGRLEGGLRLSSLGEDALRLMNRPSMGPAGGLPEPLVTLHNRPEAFPLHLWWLVVAKDILPPCPSTTRCALNFSFGPMGPVGTGGRWEEASF